MNPIRSRQRGSSLIEVLISMVVLAIGLLGLAGLQSRVSVAEMESYQRTQALLLVQDMADRIATNSSALRADIKNPTPTNVYTTTLNKTDVGASTCDPKGLTGAALDLCEWGNAIAGASESASGGQKIGTLTNGRGCVRRPTDDKYLYLVAVSWQGRIATKSPPTSQIDCGSGQYTDVNKRRVVTLTVRIAKLS